MALKSHDQCKEIAKRLQHKEYSFVLGKGRYCTRKTQVGDAQNQFISITGCAQEIASEGALKIKEMYYLFAKGYSGGALQHDPFAVIEDETGNFGTTPIIMFILDDQHAHHMQNSHQRGEKPRGANLIIITDKPEVARDLDDNPIVIPQNGALTALGGLLPLQLLAYELAMLRYVPHPSCAARAEL